MGQLIHGARYFDIRPARYPKKDPKQWVNHGKFRMTPLVNLINDVKKFMDQTEEIVILEFKEFPVGKYQINVIILNYSLKYNSYRF